MSDKPADAPEHCPGTQSDDAGKAGPCQGSNLHLLSLIRPLISAGPGCPNQSICSSGEAKAVGPDPALLDIQDRMSSIKGASLTPSHQPPLPLPSREDPGAEREGRGGEVDVRGDARPGPGIRGGGAGGGPPRHRHLRPQPAAHDGRRGAAGWAVLLESGSSGRRAGAGEVHQSNSGWSPVYVGENLSVMSIGFLLGSKNDAVIWRGPRKNGMIKQFLKVPPPSSCPS